MHQHRFTGQGASADEECIKRRVIRHMHGCSLGEIQMVRQGPYLHRPHSAFPAYAPVSVIRPGQRSGCVHTVPHSYKGNSGAQCLDGPRCI